ncbi:hypothetical protein SLS59_003146 [Nothophoma quercina]|uniref:Fungal STAND N-terminal Goodbye domain-containing protein n=1 Tax=Nothophoma quercina TaxID=749835 RepID=A0ABR3RNU5_9PLEO
MSLRVNAQLDIRHDILLNLSIMKTLSQMFAKVRRIMLNRPSKKSPEVSADPSSEPGLEVAEAQPDRSTVATEQKPEPTALEEYQSSDSILKDARNPQDAGPRTATQGAEHEILDAEVTEHPTAIAGDEPLQPAEEQDLQIVVKKKTERPDFREDPLMGQMWKEALKNLQRMIEENEKKHADSGLHSFFRTKRNKSDKKPPSTEEIWDDECIHLKPEEAVAKFNPNAPSTDSRDKCNRTKDYASKTLSVIQGLSDIIAEVCGPAYPPSKICFTAVCYLLNTAERYHQYFVDLSALFESISYVLDRFKTHSRHTNDDGLKRILQELLGCFVEICIEAVKISGEEKNWNKVKLAFRLLLTGEDTVLKDLLTRIIRLSELEIQQAVADILDKVSVMAEKVGSIEERGRKQDNLAAEAEMRKDVARVLCVNDKEQYWETTYRGFRTQCVPDTGQWLLKHDLFREWFKVDDKQRPSILALEAPDSHGKTFLSSMAIDSLWKQYVSNTDTKLTHVAYFFFGNSQKDGRTNSEQDAIASLIWQLIQTDLAFLKFVARLCRSGQLSRNPSMWTDAWRQSHQE